MVICLERSSTTPYGIIRRENLIFTNNNKHQIRDRQNTISTQETFLRNVLNIQKHLLQNRESWRLSQVLNAYLLPENDL